MTGKQRCFVLVLFLGWAWFASCTGAPGQVKEVPESEQASPGPAGSAAASGLGSVEEPFDPASITQEVFDNTLKEIQDFITNLNHIIQSKNYESWVDNLGDDYFNYVSSPEFLAELSASARLKSLRIVLRTPLDYFTNVVVPARTNSQVDDIEFISREKVRAFTVLADGRRLILYNLEKRDGRWKIINLS
jgi:hypothetical protein